MALLWSRILCRNKRNTFLTSAKACFAEFYRPEDLATGLEKQQMSWRETGNEDPFRMRAVKRHASSKANPNLVPSYYDCRVVGCICEEDSLNIVWMWLFKGEPRRCKCGHWFKLVEYKP